MKRFVVLVFLAILFLCTSCAFKETDVTRKECDFTVETFPKVDGSTSAHPLQMLVACKLLDVEYDWFSFPVDNTKRLLPKRDDPEKEGEADYITKNVVHNGTHGAYVNLVKGVADVVLVARAPSPDELKLAEDMNVEIITDAVALDAFVFIVKKDNPTGDLSEKEIQDIYTGKITNWKEVGGGDLDIHAYQRNDNSGSQELMKSLVMRELEMTVPMSPMILMGMMGPINMLSEDVQGICYSVFFFEEFMAPNEHIKRIAIDGVFPDTETIRSREYRYATEVFVAVRGDLEKDTQAYMMRRWLLSLEGQQAVKESGYVPVRLLDE
jgi:phosphate transport system substrate-binding protein